ncbi:hypothetical protein [Microbulbifer hainanensis]|uniref:hypothetical protein n=1 Tax=Microbulbifer hainanensis TaxID=2735675 RepID=UPI0018696602|nr:hypothetical protein [Microbulbifer hainanensis]
MGKAFSESASAFFNNKNLYPHLWVNGNLRFYPPGMYMQAFSVSFSLLLTPFLWIFIKPILLDLAAAQGTVNVFMCLFVLAFLIALVSTFLGDLVESGFPEKPVLYDDLTVSGKAVYWMVFAISWRWMYLPAAHAVVDRFYCGFIMGWYVFLFGKMLQVW